MRTKLWLMVAVILILIGLIVFCAVMRSLRWDFTKLSTVSYETNEYEITDVYRDVRIVTNTADVVIQPSEDGKTTVSCLEQSRIKHAVFVKDGVLVIEVEDTRKWYEHISIGFTTPKITLSLPEGEYGALAVTASTGDVRAENLTAASLEIAVTTGDVTASAVRCAEDVTVRVSTGDADLRDVACKNLTTVGTTGDLRLKNVIASEALSSERSTGDVMLDGCDAATICIKSDTGDVKGSLLSEKEFVVSTSTGKKEVPDSTAGGRCEIITTTGDIHVTVRA